MISREGEDLLKKGKIIVLEVQRFYFGYLIISVEYNKL